MATATADQHQQQQEALVSLIGAQILAVWPLLDVHDIAGTRDRFVFAVEAILRRFGMASAQAALDHYRQARRDVGLPGAVPNLTLPGPVSSVDVDQVVGVALSNLYGKVTPEKERATVEQITEGVTQLVLDQGREQIIDAVSQDRVAKGWVRVTEPGACWFCTMLALRGGAGFLYKDEWSAGRRTNRRFTGGGFPFKVHDNCVIGSTVVNGPRAEIAYRRWYEGEVIVIRTSSGDELSITPNHPVLTPRGWVEAGLLREGDEVVQRAGADLASLRVPHEHDVPAPIEDVWRAGRVNGLRRVPVAPEDFHGDGTDGDVDVVPAHGALSHVFDAALCELLAEPVRAGASHAAVADALSGAGDALTMLVGLGHAPDGIVRSGGQRGSLTGAHLAQAQALRSASAAHLLARLGQPTCDHSTRHAMALGQGLDGLAGAVLIHDPSRRIEPVVGGPLGPGSRFDPPATQDQAERLRVHAHLGGALLERLAGGVQLSRVTDLRRIDYSGHVFNLQTAEGWYDASSIVVSNCRCHAEPVFTAYEPSARMREAERAWKDATKGRSGKDAQRAFRQAWEGRDVTGIPKPDRGPIVGSGMTREQIENQIRILEGLKDSTYRTRRLAELRALLDL